MNRVTGMVKCVVGDNYGLKVGDDLKVVINRGKVISQSRYNSVEDRRRIVRAWIDSMAEFTVVIVPDETITDDE